MATSAACHEAWDPGGTPTMGSMQKTVLLMALLSLLLIMVGRVLGGASGTVVALGLALALNASAYWFSDRLVLRMAGASEISPEEAPELHRIVERLTRAAGIPKSRLFVIESITPNAFATGRDPAHAAIAVTAGIVSALSEDELTAVLSHEMAHVRNRDTLLLTVVASLAGAITAIACLAQRALLFGGPREDESEDGGRQRSGGLVVGVFTIALAPIAAMLIRLAISREREFAADAEGARILGDPLPLASALEKLELANQVTPLQVSPALAHQFVVQPFVANGLAGLFRTHPPVEERVARLRYLALGGSFSPVVL